MIVVVGAGLGGLAAAISLAAAGLPVTVLEAAAQSGGKLGTVVLDGVEVDTGPSVLTLPDVLAELLRLGGLRLGEELRLTRPSPAFRYLYADRVALDVHVELDATLESVRRTLGSTARAEMLAFLEYSARIWSVAEGAFVRGEPPGLQTLWSRPVSEWARFAAIDPLRTMNDAILARVRDPHLRMLFQRYSTYNGSDVRRAPAALNCIAHVELALGGFGVLGGVVEIARALERAADRLGVVFRFGSRVVEVEGAGVVLDSGERVAAEGVVWNGEAAQLGAVMHHPGREEPPPDSLSAWCGILRARRGASGTRVAHTVVFPEDYNAEFIDVFDRRRAPASPTVYLCAQEACHGRAGWQEDEPVFVMVNVPSGSRGPPGEAGIGGVVRARLEEADLLVPGDAFVWQRSSAGLAERFPGSGGALYGGASHGAWSAFRRPANRVPGVRGVYLAGGSAHPGGGMPLAMLSGVAAARALLADRGDRA